MASAKSFPLCKKEVGPCPGPEALPFFHSGWHRSNLKFHYSQELTFSVKIKLIERMQFFAPLADSNKKLRILGGSWELRAVGEAVTHQLYWYCVCSLSGLCSQWPLQVPTEYSLPKGAKWSIKAMQNSQEGNGMARRHKLEGCWFKSQCG